MKKNISKLNHKTGVVRVTYQFKELPWIISIIITLFEKPIHHLNFIHALLKTTKKDAPDTHAHMMNIYQNLMN